MMLLFLIVLTVTFLVGATVFYQTNLASVNTKYNTKVAQLKEVERELNTKIRVLEQIREDLKLKTAREETFTEKYTEIRGEKEELKTEKSTLEQQKRSLEDQLDEAVDRRQEAENLRQLAESRANRLQIDYEDCADDLDTERARLDDCEDQLAVCQAGP